MMTSEELNDCPFCGKSAIFQQGYVWHNKDQIRCGCQTIGCRGYYKDCPYYDKFDYMAKAWNKRPN